MSANGEIFVPVPDEYMGRVIGQGGSNIKRIQQETKTRIKKCCKTGELGRTTGFSITGSSGGCQKAKQAIKHSVVSILLNLTI